MPKLIPNGPSRRLLLSLIGTVGICAAAAGCVSMPNAGPVLPYGVTPSANGQQPPNLQIVPRPPEQGWAPDDIVRGFLQASASFVGQQQVAREYLTPTASLWWRPGWSAIVLKDGPTVHAPQYKSPVTADPGTASPRTPSATAKASGPDAATVTVEGNPQATLSTSGTYAVASATLKGGRRFTYDLVKYRGQWRISNVHGNPLLLTSTEFAADYQLRNLYFFDPSGQELVPDPVYVPLQATQADLVNGLVKDLITQPSDWLSNDATRTAFPRGTTRIGDVTVDGGTASVNLGGAISRAPESVKEQVSSQLWWTLYGAGQGQQQVKSVALALNSKAFVPESAQGNPVQNHAKYNPVSNPVMGPGSGEFYYLGARGQLMRQVAAGKAVKVATLDTGYTSLAVSPDGQYVAALRGGDVYIGKIGARSLALRDSAGGFTSLSWDGNDDLWAASQTGVIMVPGNTRPSGTPVPVNPSFPSNNTTCGDPDRTITTVRVAPDGVRVAIVFGGPEPTLAFGAIVMGQQQRAGRSQTPASISVSPFCVSGQTGSFQSVSWYGADNVIALSEQGAALTEYPVNGGTPTTIQSRPSTRSITASLGKDGGLIAGMANGTMYYDPSITGTWSSVGSGAFPAYPG